MRYIILALLSFATVAHAEKCYVVTPLWDSTKQAVECATGFVPPNVIADAPLDESGQPYPIEALDILDEPERDENGNPVPDSPTHKTVKVNTAKLDQRKKKDKADKEKADKDRADAEAITKARLQRIKAACASLSGVQKDICEHISNQQ